jgi:hypothetical protein
MPSTQSDGGAAAERCDTCCAGAAGSVPPAQRLLGQLELGLVLLEQRPLAFELPSPGQFDLDRVHVVEDEQQPQQLELQQQLRQPGRHLVELIELELLDLARRLRIDQQRLLVFGKLSATRRTC